MTALILLFPRVMLGVCVACLLVLFIVAFIATLRRD